MNYSKMQELPNVLRDFFVYMETVKGKSARTVNGYYNDLYVFFRFLKIHYGMVSPTTEFSEINISDIDLNFIKKVSLSDIYQFLSFCEKERSNSGKTRARKVSCLKSFFNYLCLKTNQLEYNPTLALDAPKVKKALPKYLTLEQSVALLDSVDGKFKERDYCILTILLNCGLRLSELVSLNISDVYNSDVMTVTGKGNKQRIIYLTPACKSAIEAYIAVRSNEGCKGDDRNALFISRQKRRITGRMVENIVNKYLEKIGLGGQGYSAHKLRHTAATLMYQHGKVDIRTLQDFLGHENVATTEIYTHITDENLKNAAYSNPLSEIKPHKNKSNENNSTE